MVWDTEGAEDSYSYRTSFDNKDTPVRVVDLPIASSWSHIGFAYCNGYMMLPGDGGIYRFPGIPIISE